MTPAARFCPADLRTGRPSLEPAGMRRRSYAEAGCRLSACRRNRRRFLVRPHRRSAARRAAQMTAGDDCRDRRAAATLGGWKASTRTNHARALRLCRQLHHARAARPGQRHQRLSRRSPQRRASRHVQHLGGLENPSFLAINAAGTHLYSVHGDRSEANSFTIDPRHRPYRAAQPPIRPAATIRCISPSMRPGASSPSANYGIGFRSPSCRSPPTAA